MSLISPPFTYILTIIPPTINYCSSNIKLHILLLFFYLKAIILLCSQESIIFFFVLPLQFMHIFIIVSITEYLKLLIGKLLPYLRLLPTTIQVFSPHNPKKHCSNDKIYELSL